MAYEYQNKTHDTLFYVMKEIEKKISNRDYILSENQIWNVIWSEVLAAMLEGETLPKNSYWELKKLVGSYLQKTQQRAYTLEGPNFHQAFQVLSPASYMLFHSQLRSNLVLKNSVALVSITFYSGMFHCFEQMNDPQVHAEDIALYRVRRMREERNRCKDPLMEVTMFLSWSPCLDCAKKIIEFVSETNVENFSIRFPSIYKSYEKDSVESLQRLAHFYAGNINIDVFQEEDWRYLSRFMAPNNVPGR